MRSSIRWMVVAAAVAAVIGAWRYRPLMQTLPPATEVAGGNSSDLIVGDPVRFENLTIFPVTSRVPKDQDRFITLAEGLKSGVVRISEVGVQANQANSVPLTETANVAPAEAVDPFSDNSSPEVASGGANPATDSTLALQTTQSAANAPAELDEASLGNQLEVAGNVNQLLLTNNSDRPLYLMPGEILVGGKQDRTVANELVVAPHTERMPLNVFCVEHGRWSPRTSEQSMQLAVGLDGNAAGDDASQPAANATVGFFCRVGGCLSRKGRLTVQSGKGQTEVWDEVRAVNESTSAETSSDAFTANYADTQVAGKLEPYMAAMEKAIADRPQVVGVIVAINGEMQAAETFESTPLFRKLWPKLLKSYVLDATMQLDEKPARAATCDIARAKAFLNDVLQAKVAQSDHRDGLVTTRGDSDDLTSFTLLESRGSQASGSVDEEAGGTGSVMGASFGGGVHSAAFTK